MPKDKQKAINFETSLEELTTIVEQMEQGELSLEASLKHFERGIGLTRQCQAALKDAEQKVQILTKNADIEELQAYNNGDES